jgi:dTDP-4-amino-4,6-dideoxygalactose transaminase
MRIDVTKTYLPPFEDYSALLKGVWERGHITNGGPLVCELEQRLSKLFDTSHVAAVANGTLALQLAIDALGIPEGEIVTTPFTYVATASSILWQKCSPVFADIDPLTLCANPQKIEAAITSKTRAIMPVHVFGIPCATDAIADIARAHQLPVVYDASHAFGVHYRGKPLLSYGDLSTCSFHATKLFHTAEGGCIATNDDALFERFELARRFGHNGDEHIRLGINAKLSELHAALGLANLDHIQDIIDARKAASDYYDARLDAEMHSGRLQRPTIPSDTVYNYAYYPVLTNDETQTLHVLNALTQLGVFPRRYFYPSLSRLSYLEAEACPIAEDASRRALCLPLSHSLTKLEQDMICDNIIEALA